MKALIGLFLFLNLISSAFAQSPIKYRVVDFSQKVIISEGEMSFLTYQDNVEERVVLIVSKQAMPPAPLIPDPLSGMRCSPDGMWKHDSNRKRSDVFNSLMVPIESQYGE